MCPICGEEFLSLIELRAHRKKCKGRHQRPTVCETELPDIVRNIEDLQDRGYQGYRESDRSS